ncbi:MAG: hypothetical protein RLZ10_2964, partial [Bacteroidota bacterium]
MVNNISEHASILNVFLSEIRSVEIQKDPLRFRRNMERIAEILGYEVSKRLTFQSETFQTPLGKASILVPKEKPLLATILRAGLSMHQGLLNYFDRSESAFISAYRKHSTAEDFEIFVEYMAAPDLDNKIWIISDPMLATGSSMVTVYKAMLRYGNPKRIFIVSAIATPQAIDYVKKHFPEN